MAQMDDTSVLVTSIGEMTVDMIGKEHLLALSISLDPRTHQGDLLIALADNSDEVQKAAIREVFEVESMFADEAVLTFRFVDGPEEVRSRQSESAPIYAYA